MIFDLNAEIMFTKSDSSMNNFLEEYLHNNINKLFIKNDVVGCKIENFIINDNSLSIHLKSNQNVRANDVLIRLRKELSQKLGKKYKIGIKNIKINNFKIKIKTDKK